MKYTSLLVLAPLLLGACDAAQSITQPDLRPAFAATKTTTEIEGEFPPFAGTNPCDEAEFVVLSGTTHITITEKFRDNSSFVLEFDTDMTGVTGFGIPSGATYTVSGGSKETIKVKQNQAFDTKLTNTFTVTPDDGGESFTVVMTSRFSISKDGEITKNSSSVEATCNN